MASTEDQHTSVQPVRTLPQPRSTMHEKTRPSSPKTLAVVPHRVDPPHQAHPGRCLRHAYPSLPSPRQDTTAPSRRRCRQEEEPTAGLGHLRRLDQLQPGFDRLIKMFDMQGAWVLVSLGKRRVLRYEGAAFRAIFLVWRDGEHQRLFNWKPGFRGEIPGIRDETGFGARKKKQGVNP